jgi:hypothetical protein
MTRHVRDEFESFAEQHTPELFPVAYALAGRQDAAEKLLQHALQKALARWSKLDDPTGYVLRAMHRRNQPRWRRREHLSAAEIAERYRNADGGRPVNLADLATAGMRRRRLLTVSGAATAVVAVVGATALVTGLPGGAEPVEEIDLTGKSVVAAYESGSRVLNPQTGEYETVLDSNGLVSPDLRWMARLTPADRLALDSLTGDQRVRVDSLPLAWPVVLAWAPDSARVAITGPAPGAPPRADEPGRLSQSLFNQRLYEGTTGFRDVTVVDVTSGDVTSIELAFPADRAGWDTRLVGAYWADPGHLAVPTIDTTRWIPDPAESEVHNQELQARVVTAISIFDLSGSLVEEIPIDTTDLDTADEPHAGLIWKPTGLTRDGQHLLYRQPDSDRAEIALLDPAGGDLEPIPFEPPPHTEWHTEVGSWPWPTSWYLPWPYAWLADGRVLIDAGPSWAQYFRFAKHGEGANTTIVDITTGHAELVSSLADAVPLPGPGRLAFADADGLSPEAAHRAF